jgi:predicted acetyltransferase
VIELVAPDLSFRTSYLAAVDEFEGAHRDGDGLWAEQAQGDFAGYAFTREGLEDDAEFARLVDLRRASALEEAPRRPGWVPCTFLWVVEGTVYLGSLAIRHRLNDFLLREGGHIGYSVRPSARGRGVATAALAAALPVAEGLGIDPALLTCDDDNVASRRVIEANGGVLEEVRDGIRRYWVPTS